MSLICPKCQAENKQDAKFCSVCGATLDKDKDFKRYQSIGGWLILSGVGMVFSIFNIMAGINEIHESLNNQELMDAYPQLQEYFNNVLFINYFLLICSVIITIIFFSKKSYFPKIFIGWLLFNFIIAIVDSSVANSIGIDNSEFQSIISKESFKSIFSSILGCIIWIPYMLMSKRVNGTFIR